MSTYDVETQSQAIVRDALYGPERRTKMLLGYDRGTGQAIYASPLYARILIEAREQRA